MSARDSSTQQNYQLWHERLGHRAFGALDKTADIVNGMVLNGNKPVGASCPGCQLGKGHRSPFPPSVSRATKPFELIHADLFGPTQTATPTGARFGSIIRDDYSGTIFFYSLAHKSDVLANLTSMGKIAHSLGYTIQKIQSDGDKIYDSAAAKKIYEHLGTTHQFSLVREVTGAECGAPPKERRR